MIEDNDDLGWYWAVKSVWVGDGLRASAADSVVVAKRRSLFWARVRSEIDEDRECTWMPIGKQGTENPTLEDSFDAFWRIIFVYGGHLNKTVFELAQLPSFSKFLKNGSLNLYDYIENPGFDGNLNIRPYSEKTLEALGRRISSTLSIDDDDWWR